MSPKASMSSKAAGKYLEEQAHKKNLKYKAKANKYKLKVKALQVRARLQFIAFIRQQTGLRSAHASRIGQRR
jgi:hypothetical protein